jgi:predicted esterase
MSASPGFIHRFVPGSAAGGPALLLLHGTGGTEDDLLELGAGLRPGAPLLSPRGQVLERGLPRFFRRLAEGVFDEPDLIQRTHDLADFVRDARGSHDLGLRPVVAVGYSNGANIAASLLLLRPEVLAGAVLFRAMVPLRPARAPRLTGVPVFLAGGRSDRMIPPENTAQLGQMLEEAGAAVALHWSPGGHALGAAEIEESRRWLSRNFPP